jgi:hypothetical protein
MSRLVTTVEKVATTAHPFVHLGCAERGEHRAPREALLTPARRQGYANRTTALREWMESRRGAGLASCATGFDFLIVSL